jgi:aminoglycoside phosphotransferase (APT) family kinase protein
MGNGGAVVRVGDTVRRPPAGVSGATAVLLEGLSTVGFPAPVPLGSDEQGRAIFRWIEGAVPVPPYPAWSLTNEALASVGRLLRRYHEAVRTLRLPPDLKWSQEMPDPHRGAIICHNDVCPENVVFKNGAAFALLDFDLASPGRPIWDLAQTARMWIPLRPSQFNGNRSHLDPFSRLRVLADAYGIAADQHRELVEAIAESRRAGSRFVQRRVRAGEVAFVEAWDRHGGAEGDAQIISWIEDSVDRFLAALQDPAPPTE